MSEKAFAAAAALSDLLIQSGMPTDHRQGQTIIEKDWRKKGTPANDMQSIVLLACYETLLSPVYAETDLLEALRRLVSLVHPDTTPASLRAHRAKVRDALNRAEGNKDTKAITACQAALAALDCLLD